MTPQEYRTALAALGLSQQAAGRWLMVSPKTAQNYATVGPSGPAARAMRMLLDMSEADRAKALAAEASYGQFRGQQKLWSKGQRMGHRHRSGMASSQHP